MIRCERCGLPVELETPADHEGYCLTGCCRSCRVGRPATLIGMVENILGMRQVDR